MHMMRLDFDFLKIIEPERVRVYINDRGEPIVSYK